MYEIGARLRKCRSLGGMTRVCAAEKLHITSDYLARLETGKQPVTYRMVERVVRELDWNPDYILHGIEEDNPFMELYGACPGPRKKVFVRNMLCLFDSLLEFGYKDERTMAYYHRVILEIINGMELDVPENVMVNYTFAEIRRINNMGKGKMAELLGISERRYSAIENGQSKPEVGTIQNIFDTFGFNTGYMMTRNPLICEAINRIYRSFDEPLKQFIMRRIRDDYDEIIIMKGRIYGRDLQNRSTGVK